MNPPQKIIKRAEQGFDSSPCSSPRLEKRSNLFGASCASLRQFRYWLPLLVIMAFVTALFWAKARDPFNRIEFFLKTVTGMKVKGMAVLPKTAKSFPVVVYLHGAGGSLLQSGDELRLLAEQNLAAVGLEYDQTNQASFDEQFIALQHYLSLQRWARKSESGAGDQVPDNAMDAPSAINHSASRSQTKAAQLSTPSIAWVGFGKGANRSLSFLLRHPEFKPQLLVCFSGGWVDEIEEKRKAETVLSSIHHQLSSNSHFLLVHGENDEIFPVADCRKLADSLKGAGISVDVRVFPGQSHDFGSDRMMITRGVGEYCAGFFDANFTNSREFAASQPSGRARHFCRREAMAGQAVRAVGNGPSASVGTLGAQGTDALYHARQFQGFQFIPGSIHPVRINTRPLLLHYWLPVGLLTILILIGQYACWQALVNAEGVPRDKWSKALTGLAWVLAIAAIAETAIHLGLPQLPVSESRLKLARHWLVRPPLQNDFDWLCQLPIWKVDDIESSPTSRMGRGDEAHPPGNSETAPVVSYDVDRNPIGTLLEHLELADLQRRFFYPDLDETTYRNFVLSPTIDPSTIHHPPFTDPNWRRPLWENFYPRIRHETDPLSAAQIVVRFLRERVTVIPEHVEFRGVLSAWENELTDRSGFERLYVAALRSVGVAARLHETGQAELFAGGQWQQAPQPLFKAFGVW